MAGFIYRWTNKVNNKKYIGSHMGSEDDGYLGSGKLFIAAIKKYGIHNFEREILERVDTSDRFVLLERESYYLDLYNAATSKEYYNVAKDVIGGNTKEGWSVERRETYRQQIKAIWESRSPEEVDKIVQKRKETIAKDPESYVNLIIEAQRSIPSEIRSERAKKANYPSDKRKAAGKLGKERMGESRRREVAKRAAANRDPEVVRLAHVKAKDTIANRSPERQAEVFQIKSKSRKGKCTGSSNGRARTVEVEGMIYTTIKEALRNLGISEGTLYKRLRSQNYPSWKFVDTE